MIDKSLGNILEVLRIAALHDGIITEEEDAIIASVTWNLAQFAEVVEKAEEDGVITQDEVEKIDFFMAQIIRDPEILAHRDGKVTEDEAFLLTVIRKVIDKFEY
ncbi:MAG: hypothetical protein ACXAC7_18710 [Candidatus Hodarchaeales archaeon]